MMKSILTSAAILICGSMAILPVNAQTGIDNTSLTSSDFRKHVRTFGLVYTLPKAVNDTLAATIAGLLKEDLLNAGLATEAQMFNIPHVTVVHIHSADPTTPDKMLRALPALPGTLNITLKNFYTTEAAKGAGRPWWLDLGIVKEGKGFEDAMTFNTAATAVLAPLRDGPLPRVTGPVFAKMGDAGKELVRTVGVSGVNVMKDGKATASHNPHNTLVYSMTPYDARIQAAMKDVADEMNRVLPDGIDTQFRDVSIVEIGFMGNVVREFYRISLVDGSAWETTSGKAVALGR